ncbi:MAG: hypothetical protein JWN04_1213 [Myxococcaceae bacterium]|nr:hypothetical protein [Myxococcaceae bacterium]
MNEAAWSDAEQLVERLAEIDVESCLDDPERLTAAMQDRQAILTTLQNTDTRLLPDERRARLCERLVAVMTRNDELLVKARERLEEVRKSMQQLAPGRAAARGYGEQSAQPVSIIRRVG